MLNSLQILCFGKRESGQSVVNATITDSDNAEGER